MKTPIKAMIVCVLLCVSILVTGCASRPYVAKTDEVLYGTWVRIGVSYEKIEMLPDGTWNDYLYANDTVPMASGTFAIYRKWKDRSGDTWYQTEVTTLKGPSGNAHGQELDRISMDGTTWEYEYTPVGEFSPDKYPITFNINSNYYKVRYRKKTE